jgi:citrate synthase
VDQDGFDNQPDTLTAAQAMERLGVKRETLYAYVSRGWIRSLPSRQGRTKLYRTDDVERLRARHAARAGHGPVAAGALRWGEPVLESSITRITDRGPAYRGRLALDLAASTTRFETVAEILWSDEPDAGAAWEAREPSFDPRVVAALLPRAPHPFAILPLAVGAIAARDPDRYAAPPLAERERARGLILRMAASLALGRGGHRAVRAALASGGVARVLARALGAPTDRRAAEAIELALVLLADHELNASTFAARVAASAGADLYACVAAALATLSGPLHGGAPDRVTALVDDIGRPARAKSVIQERTRRGESIPGFGHPLYPSGDPRAAPLVAAALRLGGRDPRVRVLAALIEAMAAAGREAPTVDCGLVGITAALGLGPGAAAAIFAIGRSAGWVAHCLEQRAAGYLLRPRALYVGRG